MRRRPLAASASVAVVAALVLTLAGCAGGDSAVVLRRERTGTIDWRPCEKVECASLAVPLDFRRPDGPRITLALARLPATGRRVGVLFTNPGGPGASGVSFLRSASDVFPAEIRKRFDLVSWDPRGVGASTPVSCGDDLDSFYAVDRAPADADGVAKNVAAARALVAECSRRSARLLPYLSTDASVRDLDAIREAMGESQLSYVGFSYGTLLGALYADRYPARVRAMVLDGAVDPARSYADSTIDQSRSFDADLAAFFAHCRGADACAFAHGGDPAAAYDDLVRTIKEEPIPGIVKGEGRILGPGELDIGVASALYAGADGYDTLAQALAQAAGGDAADMIVLADAYTERTKGGKYSNLTAAMYATGCLDAPVPRTVAAVQQLAARAGRVAPRFGPSTVWLGLPCTFWPVPPQGAIRPVRAPDAPAIVVVGATHDPATPYSWAQSLGSQLRTGHLLSVDGTAHTSYGRGDDCVDRTVDRYLLDLVAPAAGADCS